MENLKTRTVLAILGILTVFVWLTPNFTDMTDKWWPSKRKLNYGLDIQGGLHLVMGVDVDGVVKEGTTRLANLLKSELKEKVTAVNATSTSLGEIEVITSTPSEVVKFIEERYVSMLQVLESNENKVRLKYYDAYLIDLKNRTIQQAIETIRNRIDEFGVAEPSISQQGDNRIIIQLPGLADAERAKSLIKTAAKLDFMLVDYSKSPDELMRLVEEAEKAGNYNMQSTKYSEYIVRLNEDLKTKLPEKTMILFEKSENAATIDVGRIPHLLKLEHGIGGDSLEDSSVQFDQFGRPEVGLRFNAMGANLFKELTTNNVGKQIAIVLDRVVKSAPRVNDPITTGQAVITLSSGRDREKSMEEARMISMALRAGALPAALEQLEERTIGPSLGQDAIAKAQLATLIGALLIFTFILVRYKAMGVIADISLGLNILSVLGLLTTLGATLTLPGIAGIALTIGFAVDANVLINERIKEELAKGSSFQNALKEGYHRAMSAILDSNITTAATAVVLYYFGTGPVRGFAVTLLIGIVTTLFANVFISKVIVDTLVHRFGAKKLSV